MSLKKQAEGIFIRSRAQYIEENEKCTKYFYDLEKRNYNIKCIKCLKSGDKTITDLYEILKEEFKFYSTLFEKSDDNVQIQSSSETINLYAIN